MTQSQMKGKDRGGLEKVVTNDSYTDYTTEIAMKIMARKLAETSLLAGKEKELRDTKKAKEATGLGKAVKQTKAYVASTPNQTLQKAFPRTGMFVLCCLPE